MISIITYLTRPPPTFSHHSPDINFSTNFQPTLLRQEPTLLPVLKKKISLIRIRAQPIGGPASDLSRQVKTGRTTINF